MIESSVHSYDESGVICLINLNAAAKMSEPNLNFVVSTGTRHLQEKPATIKASKKTEHFKSYLTKLNDYRQEPITWSFHLPCILESTFARTGFLFLENNGGF